jgi:hypothetical protein
MEDIVCLGLCVVEIRYEMGCLSQRLNSKESQRIRSKYLGHVGRDSRYGSIFIPLGL